MGNREIKFRVWIKRSKRMLYDCGMETKGNTIVSKNVMQFTGLKDKNGKEIYEGDIVKGNYFKGIVFWNKYLSAFRIKRFDAECEVEEFISITDYECEVIGNKFKNPEIN